MLTLLNKIRANDTHARLIPTESRYGIYFKDMVQITFFSYCRSLINKHKTTATTGQQCYILRLKVPNPNNSSHIPDLDTKPAIHGPTFVIIFLF